MTHDISRLLRPKSVAVVGGGAWCRAVTDQLLKANFNGKIWPVHPRAEDICGLKAYQTVLDLPTAPDAAFVGINRDATVGAIERLNRIGAGGAVCFASGFGETIDGQDANARLLKAAGDMPILGPNCYGMINALDGAVLWPDQHGCVPVERGVAILTQSSNIAVNLTMQNRALPIAYVVTCGNQAQLSEAAIASALLDDPRVTAIGLHIEGFKDLPPWQDLARRAYDKNIPLVAVKVGRSVQARNAAISHTASLAGSDAGAQALLDFLGIARVDDLPTFLETLKILHVAGHLASGNIASISCSGGEASLIADMAQQRDLTFPSLNNTQLGRLSKALGPKVALANPLDYHTYIWRDKEAMTSAFSAMIDPDLAITYLIVDFPRSDRCDPIDWECVINAAIATRANTGALVAMVATLPELMPEDVAARLLAGGVIPMGGLAEALAATEAARKKTPDRQDLIVPSREKPGETLTEAQAKTALSTFGLHVPKTITGNIDALCAHADTNTGPFVLKTVGLAHKSETGGVALGLLTARDIRQAATRMGGTTFLLEDMIEHAIAELLVGFIKDPAHGFVITIAAGGIFAELLRDRVSLLVPAPREQLKEALTSLKSHELLTGYRSGAAADIDTILDAIEAIQTYVLANLGRIEEVEVNPLVVTPNDAIAVDALIRISNDRSHQDPPRRCDSRSHT